jgi:hypothetical protein
MVLLESNVDKVCTSPEFKGLRERNAYGTSARTFEEERMKGVMLGFGLALALPQHSRLGSEVIT